MDEQEVPESSLYTRAQAAKYLNVRERQVIHLTQTLQLPFVKVGRLVRIRKADLDEYIEKQRVER